MTLDVNVGKFFLNEAKHQESEILLKYVENEVVESNISLNLVVAKKVQPFW